MGENESGMVWMCVFEMQPGDIMPKIHRFHKNLHPDQPAQRYSRAQGANDILPQPRFYIQRSGIIQIQLRFPFAACLRESSERIPDTVGLSAFLPCMTRAGVAVPYP